MGVFRRLKQLASSAAIGDTGRLAKHEAQLLATGKLLSWQSRDRKREGASLAEVEFKIFSQFGDDGIIQWLVGHLQVPNKTFIEFGVENYRESNTRFLMMSDNWSGLVMDGSSTAVREIVDSEYYWRHDLKAVRAFIDRENINALISSAGFAADVGLLHVDLDGNDYWIWKEISTITPVIVVVEYNSVFGNDRAITIPYQADFVRRNKHHSNLYWGASLPALHALACEKGYAFVGCNSGGNNAYFVRRDKLNEIVGEVSLARGYVSSKYRESRDEAGRLTYAAGAARAALIRGMPVHNVVTGLVEAF